MPIASAMHISATAGPTENDGGSPDFPKHREPHAREQRLSMDAHQVAVPLTEPKQRLGETASRVDRIPHAQRQCDVLLLAPESERADLDRLCSAIGRQGLHPRLLMPTNLRAVDAALGAASVLCVVLHVACLERVRPDDIAALHRNHPGLLWVLAWRSPAGPWSKFLEATDRNGQFSLEDSSLVGVAIGNGPFSRDRFYLWLSQGHKVDQLDAMHSSGRRVEPPAQLDQLGTLTQREAQVFHELQRGLTNGEIAIRLGVSVNTVKKHVKNAFAKLGLKHRRQVVTPGSVSR